MPFPNKDTQFSGEFAVEAQKKSAEARKRNHEVKKTLAELINKEWSENITVNGQEITKKQLAALRLVRMINDMETSDKDFLKALEFARDTIGERPVEKVEMATIDQSVIDEVERMVFKDDDTATSN